jgi:hypothetical protein
MRGSLHSETVVGQGWEEVSPMLKGTFREVPREESGLAVSHQQGAPVSASLGRV